MIQNGCYFVMPTIHDLFGIFYVAESSVLRDRYTGKIEAAYLFGGIFAVFPEPPAQGLSEAAYSVVKAVGPGYGAVFGQAVIEDPKEIFFKAAHEYLAALTCEQAFYILLFFPDMVEDMGYPVTETAVV